jgi:IS4 transposase
MNEADYAAMPEMLEMREVQVGQWTLIRSLCDAKEVSKADLTALYLCRWHVERDLRSIKQGMKMDVLRGKRAELVRKEVAVHLLAYNLVRAVMAQAAVIGRVLPRHLSFQSTLQVLNEFKHTLIDCACRRLIALHEQLLHRIQQLRLPYRPDRIF